MSLEFGVFSSEKSLSDTIKFKTPNSKLETPD
jgi:hypothetical protein